VWDNEEWDRIDFLAAVVRWTAIVVGVLAVAAAAWWYLA
jgi:hypothetical protein